MGRTGTPPIAIRKPIVPIGPGGTLQSIRWMTRGGRPRPVVCGVAIGVPAGQVTVKC